MTQEEQINELKRQLAEGDRTLAEIQAKREALAKFMSWARSNEAELKDWMARIVNAENN